MLLIWHQTTDYQEYIKIFALPFHPFKIRREKMVFDGFRAKMKKNRAKFVLNIILGVLILFIVVCLEHFWWGWEENQTNYGLDILARIENHLYSEPLATHELAKSSVYFIEITHEDRKNWKYPELTPRDKLARMIENAWTRNAAVIVLDILMEKAEKSDSKMEKVLHRMLRENAATHVIFPVSINCDGLLVRNRFDELIDTLTADGRQIFHRGISIIEASGSDLINRYWTPYQVYMRANHPEILWNIALLAAAIREDKLLELSRIAREIKATNETRMPQGAEHTIMLGGKSMRIPLFATSPPAANTSITTKECDRIRLHSDIYSQRIRFRLPVESPLIRITADKFDEKENLLQEHSGKVVVIGNSCPDLGDYHWTPAGRLAGLHILGNAINTLVEGLQPKHIPWWLHYVVIEGAIIVAAAALFFLFPSLPAQVIGTVFFVSLLFAISWPVYLYWGIFVNFTIPVFGMSLHRFFADLEEMIKNKNTSNCEHTL